MHPSINFAKAELLLWTLKTLALGQVTILSKAVLKEHFHSIKGLSFNTCIDRLNQYMLHNTYAQQSSFGGNNSLFIKGNRCNSHYLSKYACVNLFNSNYWWYNLSKWYLASRNSSSQMIGDLKISFFIIYECTGAVCRLQNHFRI